MNANCSDNSVKLLANPGLLFQTNQPNKKPDYFAGPSQLTSLGLSFRVIKTISQNGLLFRGHIVLKE